MNVTKLVARALAPVIKAARTYGPDTIGMNERWLRGWEVSLSGSSEAVTNAYENCATAYACIDRMMKDAAGVPLVFLSDPEQYESDVGPDDPVRQLFLRPAPGFTARRLISWSVMMHRYRGEVMWMLDGPRLRPSSIVPWFDPANWREKANTREGLVGWEYRDGDFVLQRMPSDVLWVGQDNPTNPYRGQSPLQAAASSVGVEVMGDSLQSDMLRRGGERGLVVSSEAWLSEEQYDQVLANLAKRRPGGGLASRDFVIDGGAKLENPNFTKEDIDFLAWQKSSKRKICGVYGMAPSVIGDDDTAQFKSAPEARRAYWTQTLVPLLRSFEDSWDAFFQRRGLSTYVRFDFSKVADLQDDMQQLAATGKILWDMGFSAAAINERLGLGFDVDDAEAADAMPAFPAALPTPDAEPQKSIHKSRGLTNEVIKRRARDSRFAVQRARLLGRLERAAWDELKGLAKTYRNRTADVVRDTVTAYGTGTTAAKEIDARFAEIGREFAEDMASAIAPVHEESMQVGIASVQELVDGKALPWHERKQVASFGINAREIMDLRSRLIRTVGTDFIATVNEKVADLVAEAGERGEPVSYITSKLRDIWNTWSSGHAATIARTEVGTMYNTARVSEMGEQGFAKHEWLASVDGETRENHIATNGQVVAIGTERFQPVNLSYPQENGGPPEEVINCRCETIPVVED